MLQGLAWTELNCMSDKFLYHLLVLPVAVENVLPEHGEQADINLIWL